MEGGTVVLGIVILAGVAAVVFFMNIYNGLIGLKHNIEKAWANIDVLLKQRHDELPKLIDTCKGYMKYEKETLEQITSARTAFMSAKDIDAKTKAENQLVGAMRHLFAVAENYPDLKANSNFIHLQGRISELENQIADRREFFNDSVNTYNIRIQQLPDVFVARTLGYATKPMLAVSEAEKKDVKIDFS